LARSWTGPARMSSVTERPSNTNLAAAEHGKGVATGRRLVGHAAELRHIEVVAFPDPRSPGRRLSQLVDRLAHVIDQAVIVGGGAVGREGPHHTPSPGTIMASCPDKQRNEDDAVARHALGVEHCRLRASGSRIGAEGA
jgi:hypothetical protein